MSQWINDLLAVAGKRADGFAVEIDPNHPPCCKRNERKIVLPFAPQNVPEEIESQARAYLWHELGEVEINRWHQDARVQGDSVMHRLTNGIGDALIDREILLRRPGAGSDIKQQVRQDFLDAKKDKEIAPTVADGRVDAASWMARLLLEGAATPQELRKAFPNAKRTVDVLERICRAPADAEDVIGMAEQIRDALFPKGSEHKGPEPQRGHDDDAEGDDADGDEGDGSTEPGKSGKSDKSDKRGDPADADGEADGDGDGADGDGDGDDADAGTQGSGDSEQGEQGDGSGDSADGTDTDGSEADGTANGEQGDGPKGGTGASKEGGTLSDGTEDGGLDDIEGRLAKKLDKNLKEAAGRGDVTAENPQGKPLVTEQQWRDTFQQWNESTAATRQPPAYPSEIRLAGAQIARKLRASLTGPGMENVGDQQSGRLDTRRLASAMAGNDRAFRRDRIVDSDTVAVAVLVDLSGSMTSGMGIVRHAIRAMDVAFSQLEGVRYELAGFTTIGHGAKPQSHHTRGNGGYGVRISPLFYPVFRSFEESEAGRGGKQDLFFTTRMSRGANATGGTPTSEALRTLAGRILPRPEARKVVIVATDGSPDDPTACKEQVRRLEAAGVTVLAIGIGSTEQYLKMSGFHATAMCNEASHLATTTADQLAQILRQRGARSL